MENRPVLKKVRRPINRIAAVSKNEASVIVETVDEQHAPINYETPQNTSAETSNATQSFREPSNEANLPSIKNTLEQQYNTYSARDEFFDDQSFEQDSGFDDFVEKDNNFTSKTLVIAVVCSLLLGMLVGKFLFGTSQVTQMGLQGVVVNSEVPRGRSRCGIADKSQGCVLYLMNSQRQNIRAKDLYDLAAQLTGRQRFMIETGNMRYANVEIRPGDIAQLNIPPL